MSWFRRRPRCPYTCASIPFLGGTGFCRKTKDHKGACDFRTGADSDERSDPSITTA